jgi:hypothetical protein
MHPMARLLILLFVALLSGCATTSHTSPARLRYDGVYIGGDYPYGCVENGNLREFYPELWDFLRFYPDGTVIEEIAPMFITPSNSRKYLTKENNHANRRGTYSVDGNRISIVTSVPKRVGDQPAAANAIRSTGRIDGDYLRLKKYGRERNSNIPWYKNWGRNEDYRFYPY